MAKKQKNKKLFGWLFLGIFIAALVGLGVYLFLNVEDEETNLTLIEKQWIEKNKNTLIDIKVPNNLSVVGYTGTGVLFDLLDSFEKETELTLNKISYNYPSTEEEESLSFLVLQNSDTLKNDDILVMNDTYLILSNTEGFLNNIDKLTGSSVGVLVNDEEIFANYFADKNVTVRSYSSIENIFNALSAKLVDYIAIPRYAGIDRAIVSETIYPNYHLTEISNKIVLRLGKENHLNNIITKFIENYQVSLKEEYANQLMNFYVANSDLTDIEKSKLTSRVYKYGFVKDTAYNTHKNDNLYGVAAEYIHCLEEMADMEFEYVSYDNKDELINAIKQNKVDLAYIDFNYTNDNYLSTKSPLIEEMAVVSKSYQTINDKSGLNNNKLFLLPNNNLYDYINNNYNGVITSINNVSKKIPNDGLMILDKNEYLYHKELELANYKLLFTDTYTGDSHFIVKQNEETLYKITNFVVDYTDNNNYQTDGINTLLTTLNQETNFKNVYIIVLAIIFIPTIIVLVSVFSIKRIKKLKIIKKEDVLKYNDMLTNLKNRNYLIANINKWDETKIYPRTIIIADLNNLKYVNDNYGQEEGNNLIKKAAAILMNTQLEKTEIIRTDGNEFLIYLIGYSESQVKTYINKLSKEFENLPHGFGAAVGYSMIEDEIKTIDDAINEATIEMRMDKEQNYR